MSEEITEVEDAPKVKKSKGWPKGKARKTVVPAPTFTQEQFEQMLAVLSASRGEGPGAINEESLAKILQATSLSTAQAMQKAMKPENPEHPGISAMSYPEGDVKHPRPTLPFELFWNAYPMHMFPETEHWRELELACLLTPGEYTVLRKDGTKLNISVTGQRDVDMNLTRLDVKFSDPREERGLTPPKMVSLYQMVNGKDRSLNQVFMEAMNEYFTIIFGARAAA